MCARARISAMAAALGVLVAAIYYIISLRHNMKIRELEICRFVSSEFSSEEGSKRYAAMMNLEWKDLEDFIQKCTYSNPEVFSKYATQFVLWETSGFLIKKKVLKVEDAYDLGGYTAIPAWEKYKDIIHDLREVAWGKDFWSNAEFFAQEMLKIKLRKDASFKDKLNTLLTTIPTN